MDRQATLLLGRLGGNEPHIRSSDRLTDGLSISGVVLLPLDVGLYVGRRHQPNSVANCLKLARPMVRRGASFDPNQARWQLLEEYQHISTLQLTPEHHMALRINTVNLKHRLCDIETDRRDHLHRRLLRIVGASSAPTSMALTRRWRSRPQHQKQACAAHGSCPPRAEGGSHFAEVISRSVG